MIWVVHPANFVAGRNAESQLHEAMVEQRAANFEAVCHAHPIHFDQRIVGEVDLEIGVLRPLHGAVGMGNRDMVS